MFGDYASVISSRCSGRDTKKEYQKLFKFVSENLINTDKKYLNCLELYRVTSSLARTSLDKITVGNDVFFLKDVDNILSKNISISLCQ